jgi:transposase-like protein
VERVRSRNYSAVARDLGVSDNAVRKRLRTYYEGDLP